MQDFYKHGSEVHRQDLSKNLVACAAANGTILFDFMHCPVTPIVIHKRSLYNDVKPDEDGARSDRRVASVHRRSEEQDKKNRSFARTILITHAFLLENAWRSVDGTSGLKIRIESLDDAVSQHGFYQKRIRNERALPSNGLISKKALVRSLDDLSTLLDLPWIATKVVELLKLSQNRVLDHRPSEGLVLSWAACESMLEHLWYKMLDEVRTDDPLRMVKKRRNRLDNSAIYTAAIKAETLELTGKLTSEQLQKLSVVRALRNNWLHNLKEVEEKDAVFAQGVCADLFSSTFGIPVEQTAWGAGGYGGGVFLEGFKKSHPEVDLSNAFDGTK